jgi:hypothetical protein
MRSGFSCLSGFCPSCDAEGIVGLTVDGVDAHVGCALGDAGLVI